MLSSSQNGAAPPSSLGQHRAADPVRVLCECKAEERRHHREDECLDEKLRHDAAAARAERGAHRDLSAASGRAGVEQDGDIQRDDDQHEADRELHQRPPCRCPCPARR